MRQTILALAKLHPRTHEKRIVQNSDHENVRKLHEVYVRQFVSCEMNSNLSPKIWGFCTIPRELRGRRRELLLVHAFLFIGYEQQLWYSTFLNNQSLHYCVRSKNLMTEPFYFSDSTTKWLACARSTTWSLQSDGS